MSRDSYDVEARPVAAALIVAALMLSASAQPQNIGLQVNSSGRVGIGTATPAEMLDVRGNLAVSGSLSGASSVGGKAALIQGFGSGGSNAEFSFKYDFANFGNTASAIQIWNAAAGVSRPSSSITRAIPTAISCMPRLEGPRARSTTAAAHASWTDAPR